jgi:tetraacyldisaccharide 4'-kinase
MIVAFKRVGAKAIDFQIPVVSVGNLVIGGTGKTPVTIALAKKEKHPAIILRGYGRESKGMIVISQQGNLLTDIKTSGDEAYLYASSLPNATVIVDEKRVFGILKAKELGCDIVFLDDGYRFHNIKKYDILLRPAKEPTNIFCLPSGGYKETKMMYSFVPCVLRDGEDFTREVTFKKDGIILDKIPEKSLLLTAIAKPNRLLEYLPKNIECKTFIDHYQFTKSDIDTILNTYKDYTIITTSKDYYKLEEFKIPNLVLMDLNINFTKEISYK